MSHSDVISFYRNVIEEVMEDVREKFVEMGVDESVLFELQLLWESKLIDSKVLVLSDSYPYSGRYPLYQPIGVPPDVIDYSEAKPMIRYYPGTQLFGGGLFPDAPQKPPGQFDGGTLEDDTDDILDSELDDEVDGEEALDIKDIVLCQYDKVTRTKMRWKCHLRDGIMHLKGLDYVFQRGMTEFEF